MHERVFGQFVVLPFPDKGLLEIAKEQLYETSYLQTKAMLRHWAGVTLGEPEWLVKVTLEYDPLCRPAVGWKAYIDKPTAMTNEVYRRMRIAQKRAMGRKR